MEGRRNTGEEGKKGEMKKEVDVDGRTKEIGAPSSGTSVILIVLPTHLISTARECVLGQCVSLIDCLCDDRLRNGAILGLPFFFFALFWVPNLHSDLCGSTNVYTDSYSYQTIIDKYYNSAKKALHLDSMHPKI